MVERTWAVYKYCSSPGHVVSLHFSASALGLVRERGKHLEWLFFFFLSVFFINYEERKCL